MADLESRGQFGRSEFLRILVHACLYSAPAENKQDISGAFIKNLLTVSGAHAEITSS
jgi:hypothetical protein